MSDMEVTNIRHPGDLIFSLENEIMTVSVKGGENIAPGNIVTFNDNNFAIKGTASNFDASKGYGVCVFEGANNANGSDGDLLIQIATGNAYVACKAGGIVKPFKNLKVNADSEIVESIIIPIPTDITLITGRTAMAALSDYGKKTLGRSYGNPGEQVNPTNVADNAPVIVRLGRD